MTARRDGHQFHKLNTMSTSQIIRITYRTLEKLRARAKHPGEQPSRIIERHLDAEATVRLNPRGGWEIVIPAGQSVGNYATCADAAEVALNNGWTVRKEGENVAN